MLLECEGRDKTCQMRRRASGVDQKTNTILVGLMHHVQRGLLVEYFGQQSRVTLAQSRRAGGLRFGMLLVGTYALFDLANGESV